MYLYKNPCNKKLYLEPANCSVGERYLHSSKFELLTWKMVSRGFWTLVKLQSKIKQKFAHNARTKTALSGNILSADTRLSLT